MRDEERVYSPETLKNRIQNLRAEKDTNALKGWTFPESRAEELHTLEAALKESEHIEHVYPFQYEALNLFEVMQHQRHGVGMGLGEIIHSELWGDLKELGWRGAKKTRMFRLVIEIDRAFRDAYNEKDKKTKAKQKEVSGEDIKKNVEGLRKQVLGKSEETDNGGRKDA